MTIVINFSKDLTENDWWDIQYLESINLQELSMEKLSIPPKVKLRAISLNLHNNLLATLPRLDTAGSLVHKLYISPVLHFTPNLLPEIYRFIAKQNHWTSLRHFGERTLSSVAECGIQQAWRHPIRLTGFEDTQNFWKPTFENPSCISK